MQEILSQNEIDSLLEALTTGKLDVEEIKHTAAPTPSKPYDFRRPNKFSKEHLRSLEMLHQNFARLLSSFFSGYLRASINIEVASVGQMIYEEFMRSIPSPTVLTIFQCRPLEGAAIMETNSQVVFPLIDLMFGGPGTATDKTRELTDIEITVVRRLYQRVLENLSAAWHDLYEIEPEIEGIETNPRMQQMYSPNEVVALITFSVSIEEEPRGLINLCIPYIVLEPVISRLSVRQQFIRQTGGPKEEEAKWIKHWLGYSNVGMDVILGEASITIRDFIQLQTDDVLMLSRKIDHDLELYVENELKFGVQAGRVNKNLAVQVVALIEGDRDNG
ncbi:MAG: flagellar motor switch protein FliM [Peptococcaceae bacterium BRH_c4a]|nr:MAG: flagellar motor switch protein FliM [Peptococcaceae bacterium BRH_c4a]